MTPLGAPKNKVTGPRNLRHAGKWEAGPSTLREHFCFEISGKLGGGTNASGVLVWDERPLMTALGDPMTILGEVLVLPADL